MDDGAEDGLDPAVVERVRRDLAELGSDSASAPEVPPDVTARVIAAIRAEPAHTVRRQPLRRLQVFGLVVGLGAVTAGVIVGALMLGRDPAPTYPAGPTAEQITVARPATDIPLPDPQIIELLAQTPDYGPLTDPRAAPHVSTASATVRGQLCSAPSPSICTAGLRCCCCFPVRRPKPWWPWWSNRVVVALTPACWPRQWSLARNLSPGLTGTPRLRLVLHPCR